MGIFGTTKMKLFAGEDKIKKAYLGTEKIYSAGSTVTYYVDSNTYYTEEVDSGVSCLNPTPTKSGWEFLGWREDTVASGDVLSGKIMGDEPIALYAVFRQTVTVSYYQVSNSTKQQSTGNKYYNNGNYLDPIFTIYPNGYGSEWTFRGWTTGTDADASVTYAEIINRKFSSDVTLYVLLQRPVTLSYNGNGASSGTVGSETKYVYLNSYGANTIKNPSFTLKSNGYGRSGYTFTGWDLGAVDATVTLESDTTAYAQWSDNAYYAIQNGDLVNCPNAQAYIDGDFWDNSCGKITNYREPYFYGFAFRAYEAGATGHANTGNMPTNGCKYMTVSVASLTWVSDSPNKFAVYANGSTIYNPTMTNNTVNTYTIDVSTYSTVSASTWRTIGENMVAVGGFASIQFHN